MVCDVSSLYPSIDIDHMLAQLARAIRQYYIVQYGLASLIIEILKLTSRNQFVA